MKNHEVATYIISFFVIIKVEGYPESKTYSVMELQAPGIQKCSQHIFKVKVTYIRFRGAIGGKTGKTAILP